MKRKEHVSVIIAIILITYLE